MNQEKETKESGGRNLSVYIKKTWESHEREPKTRARFAFWEAAVKGLTPEEIAQLIAIKEKEAAEDPLTGLLNRRGFREVAEVVYARARRDSAPLTILAVDLDNLKLINKQVNYAAGDEAVVRVADALGELTRTSDAKARVGGDEFLALLDGAVEDEAREVAERIRQRIEEEVGKDPALIVLSQEAGETVGTVTIGMVELGEKEPLESFLSRAHEAARTGKGKKNTVFPKKND